MPLDYQPPPAEVARPQPAAPASFESQYEQARALANAGQPALALAAYDALLARSPGNVDVLLGRGIVLSRLQRWAEAEADLAAAARASPEYADVWFALGKLYQWQGRSAKAAEAYGRAAALRPGDAALLPMQPQAPQPFPGSPEAAIGAGYTWAASLSATWQDVGSGARWNDQVLGVRHYMKRASIGFEALRAHRFDQTGRAWAVDAYAGLWQGAYANLRYQHAPGGRLFPSHSGRIELYQSLGKGWEASVSEDLLGFDARVNIHGVSLARYTGNFYLQLRHQKIVSEGARSSGDRLLARWYYTGRADSYVDASASRGRSDDPLSFTSGRARSGGGSLSWVHYLSRGWGARVGADFARSGSGDARERGLSIGLHRRW